MKGIKKIQEKISKQKLLNFKTEVPTRWVLAQYNGGRKTSAGGSSWLGLHNFTDGAQVRSLVGELRFHKLCGAAQKKKERKPMLSHIIKFKTWDEEITTSSRKKEKNMYRVWRTSMTSTSPPATPTAKRRYKSNTFKNLRGRWFPTWNSIYR